MQHRFPLQHSHQIWIWHLVYACIGLAPYPYFAQATFTFLQGHNRLWHLSDPMSRAMFDQRQQESRSIHLVEMLNYIIMFMARTKNKRDRQIKIFCED